MKNQPNVRDERYYAVENASYRIGYMIIIYGLLLLIVFRSIAYHETNWDLFALVIISSFAATIYQITHKTITITRKWIYFFIAITLLAAIVSLIIGLLGKYLS
jgi:hypothetical protein